MFVCASLTRFYFWKKYFLLYENYADYSSCPEKNGTVYSFENTFHRCSSRRITSFIVALMRFKAMLRDSVYQ